MKIAIGGDPNAFEMKKVLATVCESLGHEIVDFGCDDTIYANTAFRVADAVSSEKADRGVLVCGTGIGMSIAANKVKGAYAALISDVYSAQRARLSNNGNMLCMGARVIGSELAKKILAEWLDTKYVPGTSSEPKVDEMRTIDKANVRLNNT